MFTNYTACYFTGIFYAVIRQISMLFIDNKDSVFCIQCQQLIHPKHAYSADLPGSRCQRCNRPSGTGSMDRGSRLSGSWTRQRSRTVECSRMSWKENGSKILNCGVQQNVLKREGVKDPELWSAAERPEKRTGLNWRVQQNVLKRERVKYSELWSAAECPEKRTCQRFWTAECGRMSWKENRSKILHDGVQKNVLKRDSRCHHEAGPVLSFSGLSTGFCDWQALETL